MTKLVKFPIVIKEKEIDLVEEGHLSVLVVVDINVGQRWDIIQLQT